MKLIQPPRTVYACLTCGTVLITSWVRRTVGVGGPDPGATTFKGYIRNVKNIHMCVECGRATVAWPCTPALDVALAIPHPGSEALPDFPPPPPPPPTKAQLRTIGEELLRIAELCRPPEPVATVTEYLLQLRAINAAFKELSVMLKPLAHLSGPGASFCALLMRSPEFDEVFVPIEHVEHWKYLAVALAVSTAKLTLRHLPGENCQECDEVLDAQAYRTAGKNLCASCACNWALGEALKRRSEQEGQAG